MKSSTGVVRTVLNHSDLRHHAVAEDEQPQRPPVGPGHAVPDHEPLVGRAAVPGDERLHQVAVEHDPAGGQHDLGHRVEVPLGDEPLEAVDRAQRDQQRQHHREARVDGAGDEVGREDRRVPARHERHREVEAHHGVHREHERRGQAREQHVRRLVPVPVRGRPAPAHRQDAVDQLREPCSSPGRAWSPGRGSAR